MQVNETYHEQLDEAKVDARPRGPAMSGWQQACAHDKLLMTFAVTRDSHTLAAYRARGGYEALEKALRTMQPEDVEREVTASGLHGRGGANFPVGAKWSFVNKQTPSRTTCAATPTKASRERSRTAGSSSTRRISCSRRC